VAFTLTEKAKADLKSIAAYTQRKWGKEQRKIYALQFDDAFHMLSNAPDVGNTCDYIKPEYRKFPIGSHLIFYRRESQTKIEIVRILHKHMDVKKQIASP